MNTKYHRNHDYAIMFKAYHILRICYHKKVDDMLAFVKIILTTKLKAKKRKREKILPCQRLQNDININLLLSTDSSKTNSVSI